MKRQQNDNTTRQHDKKAKHHARQKFIFSFILSLLLFANSGGAPRKEARLSQQMVVTEDSDVVFHTLPGGKKRKPRNAHDLMATVAAGRGPGKKH